MICRSKMNYYFSKEYLEPPFKLFMKEIGKVEYHKCTNCGFVISKTHSELSFESWNKLNADFHHYIEQHYMESEGLEIQELNSSSYSVPRKINPPPYLEQVMMLYVLSKNEIISHSTILDFAGGYGTSSKLLKKYFNLEMNVYDPYIQNYDVDYISIDTIKKYSIVFNSAMFEHIIKRDDLEKLNSLVTEDGCLILHTIVCEKIPNDPNWFYLEPPVHCAFHTNKSMTILMQQWGYIDSIYCPTSKCWILFKKESKERYKKINAINTELQQRYLFYQQGFVGYWKGF